MIGSEHDEDQFNNCVKDVRKSYITYLWRTYAVTLQLAEYNETYAA